MKVSQYNFYQRELASAAMGGVLYVTSRRLGIKLAFRNSSYASHQEIEFFPGDLEDPLLLSEELWCDGTLQPANPVYRLVARRIIYICFQPREGFEPFPSAIVKGQLCQDIAYLDDGRLPPCGPLVWLYTEPHPPVAFGRMANGRVRPFFEADQISWQGLSDEEIAEQTCVTEFHWAKGHQNQTQQQPENQL